MCLLRITVTAAAAAAVWWLGGWWIAAFTAHWVHCHLIITLHWDVQYIILVAFTARAAVKLVTVRQRWRLTPSWLRVLLATSKTIQCLSTQACYCSIRRVDSIGASLFTIHFGNHVSYLETPQKVCSFLLYCSFKAAPYIRQIISASISYLIEIIT